MDSDPGVRNRCERFMYYVRAAVTFVFSHVGLVSLVVGYTVVGAATFEVLEKKNEQDVRNRTNHQYLTVVNNLWDITFKNEVIVMDTWEVASRKELKRFEDYLFNARKLGYDGNFDDQPDQWTFSGALLYSIIVITTIGYGNIAPKTNWGKVVTIVYAVVGIPLMLLCMSNIGDTMAKSFKFIYWRVCCYICTRQQKKMALKQRERERERRRQRKRRAASVRHRHSTRSRGSGGSSSRHSSDRRRHAFSYPPSPGHHKRGGYRYQDNDEYMPDEFPTRYGSFHGPPGSPAVYPPGIGDDNMSPNDAFPSQRMLSSHRSSGRSVHSNFPPGSPMQSSPPGQSSNAFPFSNSTQTRQNTPNNPNPPGGNSGNQGEYENQNIPPASPHPLNPFSNIQDANKVPIILNKYIMESKEDLRDLSEKAEMEDPALPPMGNQLSGPPPHMGNNVMHLHDSVRSGQGGHYLTTPRTYSTQRSHYPVGPPNRQSSRYSSRSSRQSSKHGGSYRRHHHHHHHRCHHCHNRHHHHKQCCYEYDRYPDEESRCSCSDSEFSSLSDASSVTESDDSLFSVEKQVTVPIWLCLTVVAGYICGGALLFVLWEKWTYFDAGYFCFITLTTIGFGDIVPGEGVVNRQDRYTLIYAALYLLFGMALLAMSFNLVQEQVTTKVRKLGQKIGIISDDDDES